MFSTCLHCTKDLGKNEVIETLPIGRRLAFDAAQGRLWVVCRHCAKWNLVPFDTRLESIDACERLYRDTRTRYATDNIGLARVKEGLELVRIGEPLRPEFASWRYGRAYVARRRQNLWLASGGAATAWVVAMGLAAANPLFGAAVGGLAYQAGHLGWHAVLRRRARLAVADPIDGQRRVLGRTDLGEARLRIGDAGLELSVPRPWAVSHMLWRWQGQDAAAMGRRITGRLNLLDGRPRTVQVAADMLGEARGDLTDWVTRTAKQQNANDPRRVSSPVFSASAERYFAGLDEPSVVLGKLGSRERLALEMWLSEDAERTWLAGELKLLEREWREAERIAKINDDLQLDGEQREVMGD